jgi:hypothetical protein
MKKAIVLLLALVALGGLVFAEDAAAAPAKDQPAYTFSANADAEWQYDFDTNKSGFTNEWDLSFHYYLINDATKSTGGTEGTYGQIDVTHLNLSIIDLDEGDYAADHVVVWGASTDGDGDTLGVSAKIVSGNLWVGLGHGAYTADYDNAVFVPLYDADNGLDESSAFNPEMGPAGSIQIGYKLGDFGSVSAVVGSNTAGAVNEFSEYTVGFDAALTPVKDVLAITAGGWYNIDTKFWVATGKVAVTAGGLSANAAIDAAKDESCASSATEQKGRTDVAYDASGSIALALNEKKDSINFDAYYTKELYSFYTAATAYVQDTATTAAVAATEADTDYPNYAYHRGDFGLKFVDAGGFVEPVSFTVGVFVDDFFGDYDDMLLSVAGSGSYKLALSDATYAKPYFQARKDLSGAKNLLVQVGVEAKLFANTVLDANFESNGEGNDLNHVLTSTGDKVFTISAKVTL